MPHPFLRPSRSHRDGIARVRGTGVAARAAAAAAALMCGLLLGACAPPTSTTAGDTGDRIDVLAASSTRVINPEWRTAAAHHGSSLSIHNAGSSQLVNQLAEGAPGDVLITASRATMEDAVANGSVGKPRVLAKNTMVMVVPRSNPAHIESVADINPATRFVLCDPQVPCGDVAARLADARGLRLQPDSLEHQVADVLGKVASGEADAGWVYSTDAQAAGDAVRVIDIPGAADYPNEILGAVTTNSAYAQRANEALDLLGPGFAATWKEYGFAPA